LSRPEYAMVVQSLREIDFFSGEDLLATFGGLAADLKPWLQDAQINRDRNLRLQYLAGLGLDLYKQDAIYQEFVKFRRFPDTLFTGSPERLNALRVKLLESR
jgi:spermidine synthase